jgi:hypothetical protein
MILYVLIILLLLYIIASTSKEGFKNEYEKEKTDDLQDMEVLK